MPQYRSYAVTTSQARTGDPRCGSRWEAVLLVADSVPFSGLPFILQDLADERVWVYAEWVGPEFAPRTHGDWTPGYHGARHPRMTALRLLHAAVKRRSLLPVAYLSAARQACCTMSRTRQCARARPARSGW